MWIMLMMRAVQQRMRGAAGQRTALMMIVQPRTARHAGKADWPQKHVLSPPLRARRAVRPFAVLRLDDRAEFGEEVVGQFVQRVFDLPRGQLRERSCRRRPYRIVDARARPATGKM